MDILLLVLRLALAGVLYAFLAAILLMLWRDLQQAAAHREPAQHAGHLVVVQTAGEEAEEPAVGALLPLRPVTSIGRSPGNTIVIPDTYASSQHALLTWREGQWWLADQNSRNGTTLNGAAIQNPTIVSSGDVIGVGRMQLRLETR